VLSPPEKIFSKLLEFELLHCKKGNKEAKDGAGTAGLPSLAQGVLADLKFSRAKVHQKAVLNSRCP
jgi:hypothetical protein